MNPTLCESCGYDLAGHGVAGEVVRCPECGDEQRRPSGSELPVSRTLQFIVGLPFAIALTVLSTIISGTTDALRIAEFGTLLARCFFVSSFVAGPAVGAHVFVSGMNSAWRETGQGPLSPVRRAMYWASSAALYLLCNIAAVILMLAGRAIVRS